MSLQASPRAPRTPVHSQAPEPEGALANGDTAARTRPEGASSLREGWLQVRAEADGPTRHRAVKALPVFLYAVARPRVCVTSALLNVRCFLKLKLEKLEGRSWVCPEGEFEVALAGPDTRRLLLADGRCARSR